MPGTAPAPVPARSTTLRRGSTVRRALPAVVASIALLGASAGAVLPASAAPATAAARRHPGVSCPGEAPVTAPTFVPISCGDGSAFAIHVRWTYLSTTTGRAKGVVLLDDCVPNCAAGHFHAFAARLAFSRVRTSGGPRFTRLRVVFTTRHPAGHPTMTAQY